MGRWHSVDPVDEFHSPYVYCANSPINLVDPDGMEVGLSMDSPSVQNWINENMAEAQYSFSQFEECLFRPYEPGLNELWPIPIDMIWDGIAMMGGHFLEQVGIQSWAMAPIMIFATGGSSKGTSNIKITNRGIARIEKHLKSIDALDDPANLMMIKRLKDGKRSFQDINFYMHELKESSLLSSGLKPRGAHLQTLKWQNILYKPGYEKYLYHPSVIDKFPDFFNPTVR